MGRRPFGIARTRRGFSLLEILIATTLLAIGIVGVAASLAYATKVSRLAEDQMVAENLADGLLAEARAEGFSALSSWYTYPGESGTTGLEQTFSTRLGQSRLPHPQAWFTVADIQSDLKGVSVAITWGGGREASRVEAETAVSPRF